MQSKTNMWKFTLDKKKDFIKSEKKIKQKKSDRENEEWAKRDRNKYDEENSLKTGTDNFWELAIKTTLIVAFFPWSLLFCIWFYGMDETIYLYKAILRDMLVVVVGLFLGIISLVTIIGLILWGLNPLV